jgi:hypothetical protein
MYIIDGYETVVSSYTLMTLRGGVGWAKCTLRHDEENAMDIFLNCSETYRWKGQFLNRRWVAVNKQKLVVSAK